MSFSNKIKLTLLIPIFFLCRINSQELFLTEYTVQQGLPQEYINTITQDSSGYLWVGTGNGLARFDGVSFKTYTTNDSIADNFITCSYTKGNKIWFGHMNGQLSIYENGVFSKYSPPIPVENKTAITSISSSPNGKIWASTFASGLVLLNSADTRKIYEIKGPELLIASFCFISEQDILIGTTEGLYHGRVNAHGSIDIVEKYKDFPEDKVQSIIRSKNANGLFVATQNEGIYFSQLKGGSPSFTRIDAIGQIPVDNLQQILEDSQENLWICTFGGGLIKTRFSASGMLEIVNEKDGHILQKLNNSKCIFEDREGNLWIGNYGENLVEISRQIFQHKTFEKEGYGSQILSLCVSNKYRWLGTDKGLIKINRETNEVEEFLSAEQGLPQNAITALFSNTETELWIGTSRNGLYHLHIPTGEVQRFKYSIGKLENSVTSISGSDEKIWVGTQKGIYEIQPGTKIKKWYTIQGGLPRNTISQIYCDSKGRLWIATPTPILACLENGKIESLSLSSEDEGILLHSITEDKKGRIWIGSQGKGVFRVGNDSVLNLTSSVGLFSDFCYSVVCDSSGDVWVGHKNGLSRINTNTLTIQSITNYNAGNINFSFTRNASIVENKNRVWFGTTQGILSYNPEMEKTKIPPPIINIKRIKVNEVPIEVSDKIVLPIGKYRLQIDFIGISLKGPEKVKYRHILEGYDGKWSALELSNTIVYPRLESGKYTLKIIASSGDGIATTESKIFSLIIRKPIWKRWWFYVICIFFISFWSFFYVKQRAIKLFNEKKLLEKKVQERTAEIQQQKAEIELQRDLINKKNVDITDSIRYASKIQSAIIPSTELLEELVPDLFIINKPRDIVSGDFIWFTQKEEKLFIAVTDCTGHGVPGAIMSMLGISSLKEIIITRGVMETNIILEQLRNKIITSLNPENLDHPTYDGMSLSLCAIDFKNNYFEFSGAYNNMIYISNEQMTLLAADRLPVGVWQVEDGKYSKRRLDFSEGDSIYMFTDGYQDQFGGENDKKFSSRKLRNLLHTIHQLPLPDQKKILEKTFEEWRNGREQTDDITLVGIRF